MPPVGVLRLPQVALDHRAAQQTPAHPLPPALQQPLHCVNGELQLGEGEESHQIARVGCHRHLPQTQSSYWNIFATTFTYHDEEPPEADHQPAAVGLGQFGPALLQQRTVTIPVASVE